MNSCGKKHGYIELTSKVSQKKKNSKVSTALERNSSLFLKKHSWQQHFINKEVGSLLHSSPAHHQSPPSSAAEASLQSGYNETNKFRRIYTTKIINFQDY